VRPNYLEWSLPYKIFVSDAELSQKTAWQDSIRLLHRCVSDLELAGNTSTTMGSHSTCDTGALSSRDTVWSTKRGCGGS
jgi:hypothetical protein